MQLPEPHPERLERRQELIRRLHAQFDETQVLHQPEDLVVYECDALSAYCQQPLAVVLPRSTQDVSALLRLCSEIGIPTVARGAGTGLSGGALPLRDGVVLSLAHMNQILDVDLRNRTLTAQSGVTNLQVTEAVKPHGFYYAPDPSSQIACTIGGNIAENSGGVHCLKYGTTTNHVLGLEVVLADGEVVRLGGKGMDRVGYDLMGLLTGSEGQLGIITEATLRILPRAQEARATMAVYESAEAAGRAVASITAAGLVPAGLEIMDRLAIEAVEEAVGAGYPVGAESLLLVELDGTPSDVEYLSGALQRLLEESEATEIRRARNEEERLLLWAGRKAAFASMGRISPDYYVMDGTIPRSRLPEVLRGIQELSEAHDLPVANVFHAGDGNLHPLILYDGNKDGDLEAAEDLSEEIMKLCVEAGGVLTGEHGVGIEKRDLMTYMYTDAELDAQERVKQAFDPDDLLNPGKVFPIREGRAAPDEAVAHPAA